MWDSMVTYLHCQSPLELDCATLETVPTLVLLSLGLLLLLGFKFGLIIVVRFLALDCNALDLVVERHAYSHRYKRDLRQRR